MQLKRLLQYASKNYRASIKKKKSQTLLTASQLLAMEAQKIL